MHNPKSIRSCRHSNRERENPRCDAMMRTKCVVHTENNGDGGSTGAAAAACMVVRWRWFTAHLTRPQNCFYCSATASYLHKPTYKHTYTAHTSHTHFVVRIVCGAVWRWRLFVWRIESRSKPTANRFQCWGRFDDERSRCDAHFPECQIWTRSRTSSRRGVCVWFVRCGESPETLEGLIINK